ncbi:unnamed protein product, partial [Amoebophrya sp. A25]
TRVRRKTTPDRDRVPVQGQKKIRRAKNKDQPPNRALAQVQVNNQTPKRKTKIQDVNPVRRLCLAHGMKNTRITNEL